jgi:hypothetical protein
MTGTWNQRKLVCAGGCVALLAALGVLYAFSPSEHRFYPQCVFHAMTGWSCPGCGSLRAVHNLLHGDFAMAFRFNPLLMVLAPLGVGAWLVRGEAAFTAIPAKAIWVLLAVIVGFGVVRNLPVAALDYLRP